MINLDVEITAAPAEMRTAISHLGDRERAALHSINESIDLRDEAATQAAVDLRSVG